MDSTACKTAFEHFEVLYDGSHEHPVDVDFTLPDYCPDIQKILKCRICPQIASYSVNADTLEVDGVAEITVLYLDAKADALRNAQIRQQFSASIKMKKQAQDAVARLWVKTDYVNCRAVSARRLDIHGAFSICAYVTGQVREELLCAAPEESMQSRSVSVPVSCACGYSSSPFTFEETLELGPGKPPVEAVIRADADCVMQEVRALAGSVSVKAVLRVNVLYVSGADGVSCETMRFELPVSRTETCDTLSDAANCTVFLRTGELNLGLHADASGENTRLDLRVKLFMTMTAVQQDELQLLTDAYSTKYPIGLEFAQGQFEHLLAGGEESYNEKCEIAAADEPIGSILDVWSENAGVTPFFENGGMVYKGKFTVCILGIAASGKPFYAEKPLEYSEQSTLLRQTAAANVKAKASIQVAGLSFRIAGETAVEIAAQLQISAAVTQTQQLTYIKDYRLDTETPQTHSKAAIVAYFASEGESIWDIAKRYQASVSQVMEENDCQDDILPGARALIIPSA